MGRKGPEFTSRVKFIIINFYQQGKKISEMARLLHVQIPRSRVDSMYTVNEFRCAGSGEN